MAAPTIGEMLAEIAHRGWGVKMERKRKDKTYVFFIHCGPGRWYVNQKPAPAEALAQALAQALAEAMEASR
jgi:hypothetical protein